MKIKVCNTNTPNWREISINSTVPAELNKLVEISKNLWWTWSYEAKELFAEMDPEAWSSTHHNPILMLDKISIQRMKELASSKAFIGKVDALYNSFRQYTDTPYNKNIPSVAYFSMEYGLTNILKIYSGGLGVLAGDYLKEASDCAVDMTAVGFLYRYGYFTQSLSMEGQQIANYEAQDFNKLPIEQIKENGAPMILEVPYPGRTVFSHVWKVQVGRMSLYLMDTDLEKNSEWDRSITHQLYGGDWENRMKQEYLLGIGGILLLNKLGIRKEVYHCNEGHAALINAQRLADLISNDGLTFNEALEVVRSSSLYTVHTPVPAGHDSFEESLFGKYMYDFAAKLGIEWSELMDLGREHPGSNEKFSMSVFACNTCQEVNGVSWLHGKVSQEMFAPIWKGYFPEESHVSYVTNGVHLPTWASAEWQKFYKEEFPKEFWNDQANPEMWENIYKVSDEKIWKIRTKKKNDLIDYIKSQFRDTWLKNQGDPSKVVSILERINPNALIIGFGRRFATYKRAHLLFTDLERLAKIVNNEKYPVLFFFTGKAHPADGGGQALIRHITEISRRPEFLGKIIFLENYDMHLAKRLISGVDIWLNTPTRPLEASGTSGEKAQMNGVLNFSVKDGWWYEGYRENAGWALTEKRTYPNQSHQDQLDAATIYSMLEQDIVPLYYAVNSKGYSPEWVQYIKNSFAQISWDYTTKRMLDHYIERFYSKLSARHKKMEAKKFQLAKEMAAWKAQIAEKWDGIQVIEINTNEDKSGVSALNESFEGSIKISTNGIAPENLGLELVITSTSVEGEMKLYKTYPFSIKEYKDGIAIYTIKADKSDAGTYKYAFRLYPSHKELPHRQDFCYTKWF